MCKKKQAKVRYFSLGHKRCHYCCVQLNYKSGYSNSATVEHIIPKKQGGTLAFKNLLVVCNSCNTKRGSKNFVGFVTGSRLPRQGWLLKKYEQAERYYSERTNT